MTRILDPAKTVLGPKFSLESLVPLDLFPKKLVHIENFGPEGVVQYTGCFVVVLRGQTFRGKGMSGRARLCFVGGR